MKKILLIDFWAVRVKVSSKWVFSNVFKNRRVEFFLLLLWSYSIINSQNWPEWFFRKNLVLMFSGQVLQVLWKIDTHDFSDFLHKVTVVTSSNINQKTPPRVLYWKLLKAFQSSSSSSSSSSWCVARFGTICTIKKRKKDPWRSVTFIQVAG